MTRRDMTLLRLVLVAGLLALPASAGMIPAIPVAGAEPVSDASLSSTSLVATVGASVPGQIGTMAAGRRDHQRSHHRPWAQIVFTALAVAFGTLCALRTPLVRRPRYVLTGPTTSPRAPPRPAFA